MFSSFLWIWRSKCQFDIRRSKVNTSFKNIQTGPSSVRRQQRNRHNELEFMILILDPRKVVFDVDPTISRTGPLFNYRNYKNGIYYYINCLSKFPKIATPLLLQLFPDNALRREMFSMESNCSNLGCPWTGKFRDFEVSCLYSSSSSLDYYRIKSN